MKQRKFNLFVLGVIASIGLFIVNLMGFVDSFTDSTLGCGREWPLCNGRLIPVDWNIATVIEYTHRLIVLAVTVLVIAFTVMAWIRYRRQFSVRLLVGVAIFAVFGEAALGASSVLFTNPAWLLAFHMGFAFTAFASFVLLTITVRGLEKPSTQHQNVRMPRFAASAKFTFGVLFVAIYYGAFVTHSGEGPRFQGWPFPLETSTELLLLDVGHRLLAFSLFALTFWMMWQARRFRWARRDLFRGSVIAFGLTVMQIFGGMWLVFSHISTPAFLSHVSIVSLLFVTEAYLVYATLWAGKKKIAGKGDKETAFPSENGVAAQTIQADRPK